MHTLLIYSSSGMRELNHKNINNCETNWGSSDCYTSKILQRTSRHFWRSLNILQYIFLSESKTSRGTGGTWRNLWATLCTFIRELKGCLEVLHRVPPVVTIWGTSILKNAIEGWNQIHFVPQRDQKHLNKPPYLTWKPCFPKLSCYPS